MLNEPEKIEVTARVQDSGTTGTSEAFLNFDCLFLISHFHACIVSWGPFERYNGTEVTLYSKECNCWRIGINVNIDIH
jgi:hypothetical protein